MNTQTNEESTKMNWDNVQMTTLEEYVDGSEEKEGACLCGFR